MKFQTLKNMKISYKIALTHALMFLILQIAICSVLLYVVRIHFSIEAANQIERLVSEISNNVVLYNKTLKDTPIKDIIPPIPSKHKVYVRIADLNGTVLREYGESNYNLDIKPPYNRMIKKNNKDIHLIYCNSLIHLNGNEDIVLQIVIDIAQHLEFNTTLFKVLLILTVLGFFISILTGFIVSRVVLKPMSTIIKTVQSINADNLHMRLEVNNTKDELNELSVTLNDMVNRLQNSFEKQEQLISDVSHELKTPISVLNGYASLLERWGKDNPDILQESICRISRETKNMAGIVDDLLFLVRTDNGTLYLDKIEFDMKKLISEIIEDTRTISANCDISAKRNDHCQFFGDYRLIKQMLRIVIDNSIKYSDENCIVRICSINEKSRLTIMIEDFGIGLSNDELEKVFDRFYRADKARTRNKGGTGLGLPIAKAIADSHNGRIKAESELGKGTKITVKLPL